MKFIHASTSSMNTLLHLNKCNDKGNETDAEASSEPIYRCIVTRQLSIAKFFEHLSRKV